MNAKNFNYSSVNCKKNYEYKFGLINFFNSKRNEIKCAHIITYLSIVDKLKILNLCKNLKFSIQKEIDFLVNYLIMI